MRRILGAVALVIAAALVTLGQTPSPTPAQGNKPAEQDKPTGERVAAGAGGKLDEQIIASER